MRLRLGHRPPEGAPPEVLVAPPEAVSTQIHVVDYGPDHLDEAVITELSELETYRDRDSVTWVDVRGLADVEMLREVARIFDIHPLALSDIVHVPQAPKSEVYGTDVFAILQHGLWVDGRPKLEQISVLVQQGWVISFQEDPDDTFSRVRERVKLGAPRLRQGGSGYLGYVLFDVIVDSHFPVLEATSKKLVSIESDILAAPRIGHMSEAQTLRRQLLDLRRVLRRQKQAVQTFSLLETELLNETARLFLRDVLDHTTAQADQLDEQVDLSASLRDLTLGMLSHEMNEVMRVLTVIATIFMPLSFFAGVYGMNFVTDGHPANMPELSWSYGYAAWWAVMLGIAALMLAFFGRRGWLRWPSMPGDPQS